MSTTFRTPRTENDPDRYIRQVKGRKWQARPMDEGIRENLGLFDTIGEARRAIREYWWGRFKPRLRFARRVSRPTGDIWIAVVRVPARAWPRGYRPSKGERAGYPGSHLETVRVGGEYATAEEAHEAAKAWLMAEVGPLPAFVYIRGVG